MNVEKALKNVQELYPFKDFLNDKIEVHQNIADTVLRYLKPGDKILDFGCGSCDKTAVLQKLGFQCSGYDDLKDPWHNVHNNREKILKFIKLFDINFKIAVDRTIPFGNENFDMVMLHDVLEHLHDSPKDILTDLLKITKPQGYLFVTVPNAVNIRKRFDVLFGKTNLPPYNYYYWYPGEWRGHVREYVKNDLAQLAINLDLDIVELRSCHHMLRRLPNYLQPLYTGITNFFPEWRDTWLLVAKKKPNWQPRKSLPDNELKEVLGSLNPSVYLNPDMY